MDRLLEKYSYTFNCLPPLIVTANYDDPIYIKLMEIALNRGKALTMDEVSEEFDKVEYDLAE